MKTKNILLGIFTLMTFATYAQNEKIQKAESKFRLVENLRCPFFTGKNK